MTTRTRVHSPCYGEAHEWAALLHDAIEDAGVSADQIAERYRSAEAWGYGERVARIVVDCSDTAGPSEQGSERSRGWCGSAATASSWSRWSCWAEEQLNA